MGLTALLLRRLSNLSTLIWMGSAPMLVECGTHSLKSTMTVWNHVSTHRPLKSRLRRRKTRLSLPFLEPHLEGFSELLSWLYALCDSRKDEDSLFLLHILQREREVKMRKRQLSLIRFLVWKLIRLFGLEYNFKPNGRCISDRWFAQL